MPTFTEDNFQLVAKNDHTAVVEFSILADPNTRRMYRFPSANTYPGGDLNEIALTTLAQNWTAIQTFLRKVIIDTNTAGGSFPALRLIINGDLAAGYVFRIDDSLGNAVFGVNELGLIPDNAFTLCDNADTSKRCHFQLGSIAPGNDRIFTMPDSDGMIVLSAAALTSGRVPFATAGGVLTDDADLTFATDTLTATKMVGTTSVKAGTAAGFISSDGSTGATGSFTTVDLKTVTVKDGIITSIV